MQARRRKVTFAKISRAVGQSSLFESAFSQDLKGALDPHKGIERYGRLWRVSRPVIFDEFLAAKLGFVRTGASEEVSFDENQEDFVTELRASEQGRFSHFVVSLVEGLMVFEERPPEIRRQSFLGALAKLLRESENRFDVMVLTEAKAFFDWLETVETVLAFRGIFERPNPQWRQRTDQVRRLIEDTGADKMTIEAKVNPKSEHGLEVATSLLGQVAVHAEGGYGQVKAIGEKDGKERTFRSAENAVTEEIVETRDDSSQTIFENLVKKLKKWLGHGSE